MRPLRSVLEPATIIMTSAKKHFKRVPTSVVPRNYKLTLKPNLAKFIFIREEVIDVEVCGASSKTETA